MYAEKEQWFVFILFGVISVVGINVLLAQRDIRSFKEYERLDLYHAHMNHNIILLSTITS